MSNFGMSKEIKLEDIKNLEVVGFIKEKDEYVKRLVNLLNSLFPESFKLKMDNVTFEIRHALDPKGAYENDGNTSCAGNKYQINWIYPFLDEEPIKAFYFYHHMLTAALAFRAEISDRNSDFKVANFKCFEAFLAKFRTHEGNYDMWRFGLYHVHDDALPHVIYEVEKMARLREISQRINYGAL